MVVAAVLVGVVGIRSVAASTAASASTGRSVASVYVDAVRAFANDHGGRAPIPGGDDWPEVSVAADAGAGAEYAGGPVNVLDPGSPYMRTRPAAVADGSVGFEVAQGDQGQQTERADGEPRTRVEYQLDPGDPTSWRITVQVHDGDRWTDNCTYESTSERGGTC